MRDAIVLQAIPGTDLRPGDLVGQAGSILVRDLSAQDLAAIRQHPECFRPLAPGMSATPAGPAPGAKGNQFLRLVREDTYRGGEPFTDWEFLVDVPEITVRVGVPGKPHAEKGDVLREEEDDGVTPFRLKRGGKEIGSPEWWQVRHLFVGLREGAEGMTTPPDSDARAPRTGEDATDRLRAAAGKAYMLAVRATEAIPEAGITPGDFLVMAWRRRCPELRRLMVVRQIPRTAFAAIGEAQGLRMVATARDDMGLEYLRRHARMGKKGTHDHTSCLFVVRPRQSAVSAPIQATTAAGALFELLHQVGGKMPEEA